MLLGSALFIAGVVVGAALVEWWHRATDPPELTYDEVTAVSNPESVDEPDPRGSGDVSKALAHGGTVFKDCTHRRATDAELRIYEAAQRGEGLGPLKAKAELTVVAAARRGGGLADWSAVAAYKAGNGG